MIHPSRWGVERADALIGGKYLAKRTFDIAEVTSKARVNQGGPHVVHEDNVGQENPMCEGRPSLSNVLWVGYK